MSFYTLPFPERRPIHQLLTAKLGQRPEIIFAYLFGSFHSDPFFRDIDVGVFLKPPGIPCRQALDYELDLSLELEPHTGYPVDIKLLNCTPAALCYHASRGLLLFSRDEETRCDWLEMIWDMYLDMQHFRENNLRDLLAPGFSGEPGPGYGPG